MKKFTFTLAVFVTTLTTAFSQNFCTNMRDKERSFNELSKKYFDLKTPTAREKAEYEGDCIAYKSVFAEAASQNILDHNIPQMLGLKVSMLYMKCLEDQGKYKKVLEEATDAYEHFFRLIYFYEKNTATCSIGSGYTMVLTKADFQTIASPYLCITINAAFETNDPDLACGFFMGGICNEGFKRTADLNKIAGQVMQYRLKRNLVDDTTFMAAYNYLKSMYTDKSLLQLMNGFGTFPEDDAIKVITNPMFVTHKFPEVRRLQFAYYPDSYYFQDLYEYLKGRDSVNTYLEHNVLKMLLKIYYANNKKGIDVMKLSDELRCCMRSDESGTKAIPTIQKIINSGDKELMLLLADFIREAYGHNYFYPDENYGAYLIYRELGNEKLANKMYNRIEKRIRDKYVKR